VPLPVWNPPSRFVRATVAWCDEDAALDASPDPLQARAGGDAAPLAALEVYEEQARTILSENDSPDLGFRWSLNPYRGCYHGCAYCYARPTHAYLDLGAGTDFERRIAVKVNAAALLREAFERPTWRGEVVAFSGVTDCYQPLEAAYRVTRACLEVCLAYRNPVGIVTKGAQLLLRDLDLLVALASEARCTVTVSVPFADDDLGRLLEPWAPPVSRRFEAVAALARAGLRVGVNVAPLIPGLSDASMPAVLARAAAAGASYAGMTPLRLPAEVAPVFFARLSAALPEARVRKVRAAVLELRGGRLNDPRFGHRMAGHGPRWAATERLFATLCRRHGLETTSPAGWALGAPDTFRRPRAQLGLFELNGRGAAQPASTPTTASVALDTKRVTERAMSVSMTGRD
jgi:DNA repair photolyase